MNRRELLLALGSLALAGPARAGWDSTYGALDGLLRAFVDDAGRVDYAGLRADGRLADFLAHVQHLPAEEIARWSRGAQVAFTINVYNACTLQTILDAGIPKSIRDIQPDPWAAERWAVAGRKVSLNWLEHERLRKELAEPRAHFVLVCAARSCPKLRPFAFLPDDLDRKLDAAARDFLNDPSRNRVDAAARTLRLSRVFEWYIGDFQRADAPPIAGLSEQQSRLVGALADYWPAETVQALRAGTWTLAWNEYDWALNGR